MSSSWKSISLMTVVAVVTALGMAIIPARPVEGGTLYEYYNSGDNDDELIWDGVYEAQTFTASSSHVASFVRVKLRRHTGGSTGTITVSLRATDASGHPTGPDLASGTFDGDSLTSSYDYEWRTVYFTSPYSLTGGTKYAIVVEATAAGYPEGAVYWACNNAGTYPGGNGEHSAGGVEWWSDAAIDYMFEVWGETANLYEYYSTGDTTNMGVYGDNWYAQTFTAVPNHSVTCVRLKLRRDGAPGNITVSIRATDASGHPTGADLASQTIGGGNLPEGGFEWHDIAFITPYSLTYGTKYAIVLRAPSGSSGPLGDHLIRWICALSGSYAGGNVEQSLDGGVSWTNVGYTDDDFLFEVRGLPGPNAPPELSLGFMLPTTGKVSTDFWYNVYYYDADGDAPTTKYVCIDNSVTYTMGLWLGAPANGAYLCGPLNLPLGTHYYYFYFEDGHGGTARLPAVGSYIGPTVTDPDCLAIFRQGGTWFIDTNHSGTFQLGTDYTNSPSTFGAQPTDKPVAIDWDGDGRQEMAILRQGGTWFIDTNRNGTFQLGVDALLGPFGQQPGDVPVAIDWDGDSRQEMAIFRQGGTWFIDTNRNGTFELGVDWTNSPGLFGKNAGDIPIVVDWVGDRSQEMAIFRQGGTWFIDTNRNGTFELGVDWTNSPSLFGKNAGDVPLSIRGW